MPYQVYSCFHLCSSTSPLCAWQGGYECNLRKTDWCRFRNFLLFEIHWNQYGLNMGNTRCSFCRLIRHPGSFSERCVWRRGIPWQTECHSFGDYLISESVSVVPSIVTEASFYCALFCVFMACGRYNLEQRVFIYDCYVKTNSYMQMKISP
jgi:hypothetical protein